MDLDDDEMDSAPAYIEGSRKHTHRNSCRCSDAAAR
jgi:hypothetical protein